MKELISIIVPVYNAEKYLSKCLDSIINQSYKNLEILLINDGSKDSSKEICDEYTKNDNRIILVDKPNGGVSSARNAGLDIAKGEYILFIDADDYIESNMVEGLYKNICETNSDIVACGYYIENEKEIFKKPILDKKILDKNDLYKSILNFNGGITQCPWNKMFKNDIIQKNKIRFDKTFTIGEDMLFCIEYIHFSKQGSVCEEILYHYITTNSASATNGKINKRYVEEIQRSYEEVIKIYKEKELGTEFVNYAKEMYIDTFKGCQSQMLQANFVDKELTKKYSRISKEYFKEIKSSLPKMKILRNYISLYFPKIYYVLYKLKNR